MAPTKKKTAATKAVNRPLKNVGPPDASKIASAGSTIATKKDVKARVTRARSQKGKSTSPYPNANDDDGQDDDESPNLWSEAKSPDYDDSDSYSQSSADDGSDDEYSLSGNTSSNTSGNSNTTSNTSNNGVHPDPNGRVKGRDLIPWTRPRMIEKLVLHLQYEAELAGIKLPWDAAVKRLHPGSKEGAAIQQLSKLRGILLTEGHMVPPKAKVKNKRGLEYSPHIRGYIRPDDSGPYDTRVVGWGEKIVDLSKNIENPGIYRGSGKYPRFKKGSSQPIVGAGQKEHRSRSDSSTADTKRSLMVTLKLPSKVLAKFPPGTGYDRKAEDDQNVDICEDGDQATYNADVKTGITESSDFEGRGEKSELDDDSVPAQKAGLGTIKSEDLDDQGDYKGMAGDIAEASVCDPNQAALNWPTGNLSSGGAANLPSGQSGSDDTTMVTGFESRNLSSGGGANLPSGQSGSDGNTMMTGFESAVGALAFAPQFGIFGGFNPSIGGPSGIQNMYSSGHFDPYSMYNGPALMAMAMGQNFQNSSIPGQMYPFYPSYQGLAMSYASDASAGQTLPGLSSGTVTPGAYELNRNHTAAADLNGASLSNAGNSPIATDQCATGLHSVNPPPVYSPGNQLSTSSYGGDSGDNKNFDVVDHE